MSKRTVLPDGKEVSRLRRSQLLTLDSMVEEMQARGLGISRRKLVDIEQGRPVSLDVLFRVAKFFNVAPNVIQSRNRNFFQSGEVSDDLGIQLFQAIRYDMEGNYSKAVEICEQLRNEIDHSAAISYATICVQLATFYDHQGRQVEALNILDHLFSQANAQTQCADQYWWAVYQNGILLRQLREYDEAKKWLNKVLNHSRRPDHIISALHQLGVIDFRQYDYDAAEDKFKRCLEERWNDASNYRLVYEYRRLGEVYAQTSRLREAREAFNKSMTIAETCYFQRYVEEIKQDMRKYNFSVRSP